MIEGFLNDGDEKMLAGEASSVKNGIIVEIGCWLGKSTRVLSENAKTSKVYSVDPMQGIRGENDADIDKRSPDELMRILYKNMEGCDNWELIRKTSEEAVEGWDKPIDLMFIDGLHDYDNVYFDALNWSKFVKPNGIIMFHDYRRDNGVDNGVKKAVDELSYLFKQIIVVDSMAIGIKK